MATVLLKFSQGCIKCVSRNSVLITRGKKHNVQRPRVRIWPARVMESITRPIYYEEERPPWETCSKIKKAQIETEVDEFEEFVYRHVKKMFLENRMILVCQQLSMTPQEMKNYRNIMMNNGMKLQQFNNNLVRRTVTELTEYENMKPWIIAKTVYISSPEPLVKEAVKMLRKLPDLILFGGLVDKQLFSKEGLLTYSKLPNIEQLRGELVSVLNMAAGGRTHSLLESHQQNLCRNLAQYVKQKSEEEKL